MTGSAAQSFVFGVLAVSLVLFVWDRWRYDLVAVGALLALGIVGIVPAESLFLGFGHPAVVTVAAVLVVSRGLSNAGLVRVLAGLLIRVGPRPRLQQALLVTLVTAASALVNNVGALALMMPVAIRIGKIQKFPASAVLMPMAFGSLLGGLITLIGTPPNIILANIRREAIGTPFGMFDFAPVGGSLALAGVAFMLLGGSRLVVPRGPSGPEQGLFKIQDYLTEVRVPEGSDAGGLSVKELGEGSDVLVLGLVEKGGVRWLSSSERVGTGDLLVVEAGADDLALWIARHGLKLEALEGVEKRLRESADLELAEAVVLPNSSLVGHTVLETRLRNRFRINLLAVSRRGTQLTERPQDIKFQAGDVLLLEGHVGAFKTALADIGCAPLATPELQPPDRSRLLQAAAIFGMAIIAMVLGVMSASVALMTAALVMVFRGIVPVRQVYSSIDWPVVILLGALIPVGQAMESTGGAQRMADLLLQFGDRLSPSKALALLLLTTILLSNVINNAAAAVLMGPVGLSLAAGLEAAADPFLMGVAVAASCAFLTPVGHQSNILVMGPGGYRFRDYWRLGLPLTLLVFGLAWALIPIFWPF